MSGVEWYVCWVVVCGLIANLWLCLKVGKVFGRIIYAALAACSFVRFAWACGKAHGFKVKRFPAWIYAPQLWAEFFLIELEASQGTLSHMGGAGVWNGIGDWTVFPSKESA